MAVGVEVHVEFDHLDEYEAAAKEGIDQALFDGAAAIQKTAQAIVPVLTGHLRSSIHPIRTRTGWIVAPEESSGQPVEYAGYVEFGTRYMAARPYMRVGYELNRFKISEDVTRALRAAASRASR